MRSGRLKQETKTWRPSTKGRLKQETKRPNTRDLNTRNPYKRDKGWLSGSGCLQLWHPTPGVTLEERLDLIDKLLPLIDENVVVTDTIDYLDLTRGTVDLMMVNPKP
jgi:hypothetical protein